VVITIESILYTTKDTNFQLNSGMMVVFTAGFNSTLTHAFAFTGCSTMVVYQTNSTTNVQNEVDFNCPDVVVAGVLNVGQSATIFLNSGSLTINSTGVLQLQPTSVLIITSGFIQMYRTTVYGGGTIKFKAGYWKAVYVVFIVKIFIDANSRASERRPNPLPSPTMYLCGNSMTSVSVAGTLDVDMSPNCAVSGTSFSLVATDLTIQPSGVLYLGNVTSSAFPVYCGSSFSWQTGSWLSVELTQQPASGSRFTIIRYPATIAACVIPATVNTEVVSSGFTLSGTGTVVATVDPTTSGMCLI
jgi:hypothetical protein